MINQVVNYTISIFEVLYPNAIAIIAFDNNTNHDAISENSLNAAKWILILEKNVSRKNGKRNKGNGNVRLND